MLCSFGDADAFGDVAAFVVVDVVHNFTYSKPKCGVVCDLDGADVTN